MSPETNLKKTLSEYSFSTDKRKVLFLTHLGIDQIVYADVTSLPILLCSPLTPIHLSLQTRAEDELLCDPCWVVSIILDELPYFSQFARLYPISSYCAPNSESLKVSPRFFPLCNKNGVKSWALGLSLTKQCVSRGKKGVGVDIRVNMANKWNGKRMNSEWEGRERKCRKLLQGFWSAELPGHF